MWPLPSPVLPNRPTAALLLTVGREIGEAGDWLIIDKRVGELVVFQTHGWKQWGSSGDVD